jgi:murein DD-endopeptidase MepM/ murein hydrolase activator NlpD
VAGPLLLFPLLWAAVGATAAATDGATPPSGGWTERRPPVVAAYGHELRDPWYWPVEPPSPAGPLDADRFGAAVAAVCGRRAALALGTPILAASAAAGVDPFLLGALAFEQSGCDARLSARGGYGLLRLHPAMYLGAGNPPVPVDLRDLDPARLLDAAVNLRAGARLLAMWQQQHAEADIRFPGVPHRAAVSHFIWGDRVPSSGAEDRVLTARRRLLEHYRGRPPLAHTTRLGLAVVSPLEGAPRVATSGLGEDRDGGARRHRGVDIAGAVGEPVRSVADGMVTFAGVDLPGSSAHEPLSPRQGTRWAAAWSERPTGPGGLYVCIRHMAPRMAARHPSLRGAEVSTCYFHLGRFRVRPGQRVRAGEEIGAIGLTGVHTAPPHLHFELHVGEAARNPVPVLGSLVIPPRETVAYRNAMAAHRARWRAAHATLAPDGVSAAPGAKSAPVSTGRRLCVDRAGHLRRAGNGRLCARTPRLRG